MAMLKGVVHSDMTMSPVNTLVQSAILKMIRTFTKSQILIIYLCSNEDSRQHVVLIHTILYFREMWSD